MGTVDRQIRVAQGHLQAALREGKVLSAANVAALDQALAHLASAADAHAKMGAGHQQAGDAISGVLGSDKNKKGKPKGKTARARAVIYGAVRRSQPQSRSAVADARADLEWRKGTASGTGETTSVRVDRAGNMTWRRGWTPGDERAARARAVIARHTTSRRRAHRQVTPAHVRAALAGTREQRTVNLRLQARSTGQDGTVRFSGYASTTGTGYDVRDFLGAYRETIQPGAFRNALAKGANVPLLVNHEGLPVASTQAGTLRLTEDQRGLKVDADLDPRSATANDLIVALQRGDVDKMSFSFSANRDSWNDAYDQRSVEDLELHDVSVVTYPANPATSATVRARRAV